MQKLSKDEMNAARRETQRIRERMVRAFPNHKAVLRATREHPTAPLLGGYDRNAPGELRGSGRPLKKPFPQRNRDADRREVARLYEEHVRLARVAGWMVVRECGLGLSHAAAVRHVRAFKANMRHADVRAVEESLKRLLRAMTEAGFDLPEEPGRLLGMIARVEALRERAQTVPEPKRAGLVRLWAKEAERVHLALPAVDRAVATIRKPPVSTHPTWKPYGSASGFY